MSESKVTVITDDVPVLTLDPVLEMPGTKEEVAVTAVKEPQKEVEVLDDSMLNEAQKQQVEEFVKQIDLTNSTVILQYGAGAQQKVAGFSSGAMENVKTKELDEIGDMLGDLVSELKDFDVEKEEKGFFGFFKKGAGKIENMRLKYNDAEVNVQKIVDSLEKHQIVLLKDISTLDQLYALNLNHYKELSMYILAGKKKIQQTRQTTLVEMRQKAEQSELAEDAQALKDMESMVERFEKKIYDLELTRTISMQMAPQIRLVQNNDTVMVEKIQSTIVNTIPLWKSQMVLTLGIAHSTQAAAAQQQVTDMTNELLKKNAQKLKIATVETAKQAERGIVDMETLKETNESLISTLDEVMLIQKEGKQKRMEAEAELSKLEGELKEKLLAVGK